MIAIGRYFVFIMLMTGTILSDHKFSKEEKEQFLDKILKLHNDYRAKHGVGQLTLNANLSKSADEIMNKLNNTTLRELPENEGVNMGFAELKNDFKLDDDGAKELFLKWYDTGAGYDYCNEPSQKTAKNAAAFTQIVWANTTEIGLSVAVNTNGYYYDVIATYSPRGNQENQYKKNVLEPPKTQECFNNF